MVDALRRAPRTVDANAVLPWIDEPSQTGAVLDVFGHLVLQALDVISRRTKLAHEVRAKGREPFLLLVTQGVPSLPTSPGGIGGALGSVRKREAGVGVEAQSAAVLVRPIGKPLVQLAIAPSSLAQIGRA